MRGLHTRPNAWYKSALALQLMGIGAPVWSILLTIFALNFRHVLYSASLSRHLGAFSGPQKALAFFLLVDPLYAASELRAERKAKIGFGWYAAYGLFMYVVWVTATIIGFEFGRLIRNPEALGIDFLLPIYFLGLLLGFRKRQHWLPVVLASGAAAIVAYLTVGSPWHVSIGALCGVAVAAVIGAKPAGEAVE